MGDRLEKIKKERSFYMDTEKKILEKIDLLIEKANKAKSTYQRRGGIGFPTLDADIFEEWRTGTENLLLRIVGEESSYHRNFTGEVKKGFRSHVDSGIGILRALKEDFEQGFLLDIKDLVAAELFTDFLDMAKHLLDADFKDPAVSLIGAVLENGLRKICEKNEIKTKASDNIAALNTKLADKNIYNRLIQKQIQAWKAIRDSADHGRFDEYKKESVEQMLSGVRMFLTEKLSR